jgi:hypothetical protein
VCSWEIFGDVVRQRCRMKGKVRVTREIASETKMTNYDRTRNRPCAVGLVNERYEVLRSLVVRAVPAALQDVDTPVSGLSDIFTLSPAAPAARASLGDQVLSFSSWLSCI